MKHTLKTAIGALTLSALAPAASARDAGEISPSGTPPSVQTKAAEQIRRDAPVDSESTATVIAGAVKSADLIDREVVNLQGESLGSVQEIAIDVESGRIVQVILSTGGFLEVGATATAVPPGALVLDTQSASLMLDSGKQHLLGAPPFDASKWSGAFTVERLEAQYKHFGLKSSLDFIVRSDQPGRPFTISESRLDGIQRTGEIVGLQVANLQNEAVGKVEEILFDLTSGRVLALVVATGEFLGIEGELSAIPAAAFRLSTDREILQIDTSKADLGAAPHFKANQWPDFTQADTAGAIFAAYSIQPYFRSGTTSKRSAIADGSPRTNPPATQGTALSDVATTTAIQSEIRALENVSSNARNVRVVTNEGHTTLSGPVDTAEEKQIIGEIADRNNQKDGVENLLVVKVKRGPSE